MASNLKARIQKLETIAIPKKTEAITVWLYDGEYHERRTKEGELVRLNNAEWAEYTKGERIIKIVWPEDGDK